MGKSWRKRSAAALATLATLATLAPAPQAEERRTDGPFNVLEWSDDVKTSRDGYAIWVSLESTQHQALIPGYTREVGPPEQGIALHVACRARGSNLDEMSPPVGAQGGIYLENHPQAPDVYTVLDTKYWILTLSGGSEERWPVQVRMGSEEPTASELVRARIDYSISRPGLDIALAGPTVLDAILGKDPIEISVQGEGIGLSARFTASHNARRAAALMRTACAKTSKGHRP